MAGSQKWNYWTKWTAFLKIPDTYCPVIFQKSCIDFTFPPAFFVRLLFEVNIFWEWSQTDGVGGRCFSGPVVDFWEFGRGPWEKSFCNLPLLNFLSVYTCHFLSFHDTVSGDLSQLSQIKFMVSTTLSWLPVSATPQSLFRAVHHGGSETCQGWPGLQCTSSKASLQIWKQRWLIAKAKARTPMYRLSVELGLSPDPAPCPQHILLCQSAMCYLSMCDTRAVNDKALGSGCMYMGRSGAHTCICEASSWWGGASHRKCTVPAHIGL